jgi:hypothetical protein
MKFLYELAVLGTPSDTQLDQLEQIVSQTLLQFGLELRQEVSWHVGPAAFNPNQQSGAAAVFFGAKSAPEANLQDLVTKGIPILPVVSDLKKVHEEIPPLLQPLNCLAYSAGGAQRVATALLECAGLLPRQRRVFLSYKRDESSQAAMQLFDALSARHFDVFLDTYGVAPAEDFQTVLWHRLCECDVLVMLDTSSYFASRWTSAEFGRALAKNISVLQVGWPGVIPSRRTATASRVELLLSEIDTTTGRLTADAVDRICLRLESVRSQSHAVRSLNLVSNLRGAIEQIGGSLEGVGPNKAVYLRMPDDRKVVVYPTVGVPTSLALHDATTNGRDRPVAVIYDPVGLHPDWVGHLDWLGQEIRAARWVKANEAAWQLADWMGA